MNELRSFVLLALAASLSSASLCAQQGAENNLARLYVVDVKTGMAPQFEAAFKAHLQWRREQSDPWQWTAYQLVNGERLGHYVIRSGSHSWADFDAYEDFLTQGSPHFYTAVGAYVESVAGYITRVDPSLARWPEDESSIRYLTVIDYWIKPDRAPQFNQALRQIHEAIGKSNWPVYYAWEATVNGGPGGFLTLVLPHGSYQDMAAPEKSMETMLTEVYGAEKAREILQDVAVAIDRTESHVAKIRLDLSLLR